MRKALEDGKASIPMPVVKHRFQCQAGCHIAEVKQYSVISSECLEIDVLQRNGGSRGSPSRLGTGRWGQEGKWVGCHRVENQQPELKLDWAHFRIVLKFFTSTKLEKLRIWISHSV